MFIKCLILTTSIFMFVQNCYATNKIKGCTDNGSDGCTGDGVVINSEVDGHDEESLNDALQEMERKIKDTKSKLAFKYLFIEVIFRKLENKSIDISNEMRHVQTYIENVLNKTLLHYQNIETKARATGVLNYTSPYLFTMRLAGEDRKDLIEPLQRIITNSHIMNENTKQQCISVLLAFVDIEYELIDDLSKIEEEYPEEFSKIETIKGWNFIHHPMPSNSTSEILHVSEQIAAAGKKSDEKIEPLLKQINKIENILKNSTRNTSDDF